MQGTEKQMDFLKGVISEELYTALAKELEGKEGIKLANLAGGAYVGREKFDALRGECEALKSECESLRGEHDALAGQLRLAQQRADALESAEARAQEWKQKAEQTAMEAEEKIAAVQFDFALEAKLREAGARNIRAARALLDTGALRKAADFDAAALEALDAVRQENPFLFGVGDAPAIVAPATGGVPAAADGALRRAMGLDS